MDIPYNNRHMEDVRLIAQKCFKKLIREFLEDLDDLEDSKWLRRHRWKWEARLK